MHTVKCCTLKTLSYLSAIFQLVLFSICTIGAIVTLVISEHKEDLEASQPLLWLTLVVVTFYWSIVVLLLMGLKQNRRNLVTTYLFGDEAFLAFCFIYFIYEFIMGFINKENVCSILLKLFIECIIVGFALFLTLPIHKYRKEMKISATYVKEPYPDEESGPHDCDFEEHLK